MENNDLERIITGGRKMIGGIVHEVDRKILAKQMEKLKPLDLTFSQALVILHIYNAKDTHIFQKDLERKLGLTNPSVTSLVKTMCAKDLIYRIQSERDGRYFHLHLTPKSLALVNAITESIIKADDDIISPLSIEEAGELIRLLNKLL